MEINNLKVNILHVLWDSGNNQHQGGIIHSNDLYEEFSDLPKGETLSTVNAMVDDG